MFFSIVKITFQSNLRSISITVGQTINITITISTIIDRGSGGIFLNPNVLLLLQRRRSRIAERLKALQELLPHPEKVVYVIHRI